MGRLIGLMFSDEEIKDIEEISEEASDDARAEEKTAENDIRRLHVLLRDIWWQCNKRTGFRTPGARRISVYRHHYIWKCRRSCGDTAEKVKDACCAVCDVICQEENGGEVASASNDGYSESYVTSGKASTEKVRRGRRFSVTDRIVI